MEKQQLIRFFRRRMPEFTCAPGCHDCCGPVMVSTVEIAELPMVPQADRDAALARWDCIYLGADGCSVYEDRPLICRMFGNTERLACPKGRRPERMLDPAVETQIELFFQGARHVLV